MTEQQDHGKVEPMKHPLKAGWNWETPPSWQSGGFMVERHPVSTSGTKKKPASWQWNWQTPPSMPEWQVHGKGHSGGTSSMAVWQVHGIDIHKIHWRDSRVAGIW